MNIISKENPPSENEIANFIKSIDFDLPKGFIDFYRKANGADIDNGENYIILWPLTDLIKLNKGYMANEYIPEFFLFGSNGGDAGYATEKSTGKIFEIPFIEMSKEDAIFICDNFIKFVSNTYKT